MSKNLSPAVTLTPEQDEQRRLAAAEELLEGEKSQAQIAGDHGVTRAAVPQWKQTLV
jgi:transposase-like protein